MSAIVKTWRSVDRLISFDLSQNETKTTTMANIFQNHRRDNKRKPLFYSKISDHKGPMQWFAHLEK